MADELLEKETIVLEDIERILAELRPGQYEPVVIRDKPVTKKRAARTKTQNEPEQTTVASDAAPPVHPASPATEEGQE
jgi:hypothetical protein